MEQSAGKIGHRQGLSKESLGLVPGLFAVSSKGISESDARALEQAGNMVTMVSTVLIFFITSLVIGQWLMITRAAHHKLENATFAGFTVKRSPSYNRG